MSKKLFFLMVFVLLHLAASCFGQESLILNGSFKELTSCPETGYNFPAKHWAVLQGTPDLFAACVRRKHALAVPSNYVGVRSTFSGYNYAGLFLVFAAKGYSNKQGYLANEAIYTRTTKTLKEGKRYKLSLVLSLADSAVFCTDSLYCSISKKAPVADKAIKGMGGNKFQTCDSYGFNIKAACLGCWNTVELTFVAKHDGNYLAIGLPRTRYTHARYLKDLAHPVRALPTNKLSQMTDYYYLDNIVLSEE